MWPIALLKKINQSEGAVAEFMEVFCGRGRLVDNRDAVFGFVIAELVVGVDENRHNGDQRFKAAAKTAHTAGQNGEVMAQIGIDPLDSEGVVFVVDVSHMLTRIDYVNIAQITIGAVLQRGRRGIDDALDTLRRLVERDRKTNNLARFPAHHRN